jgi:hypothetical protein
MRVPIMSRHPPVNRCVWFLHVLVDYIICAYRDSGQHFLSLSRQRSASPPHHHLFYCRTESTPLRPFRHPGRARSCSLCFGSDTGLACTQFGLAGNCTFGPRGRIPVEWELLYTTFGYLMPALVYRYYRWLRLHHCYMQEAASVVPHCCNCI